MANDLDDAVGEMADDFLDETGEVFSYTRGVTTYTVTLRKSTQRPVTVETADGFMEVRAVDFIGMTASMTFWPPERGDEITDGTNVWEVRPMASEKCYRAISPKMTRIHTKQTT